MVVDPLDNRTGLIGIIHGGKGLTPWLTTTVTGQPFHHCVIATSPTHCIGAERGGARNRPQHHFAGRITWVDLGLTPAQRRAVARHALMMRWTPYNWWAYVCTGLQTLGWSLPFTLIDWIQDRVNADCVQLVDRAHLAAGIDLNPFHQLRNPGVYATEAIDPQEGDHGALETTFQG